MYFQPGESFYWYEGHKFNQTEQPEVFILKESELSKSSERRKIVIKCPLPPSDVLMSLNGGDQKSFKSAQSHPLAENRATVSAFHIKLAFLEMQGLNINLKKNRHQDELVENFLDFSSQNFINKDLFKNNRAPEKFLIFYDSKCRECKLDHLHNNFDPFRVGSIMCSLKVRNRENRKNA